jgi:DNA-binding CsgD family transcriptional regulator
MYAEKDIQGEEVIGRPGQALNAAELRVLVGLADGETPNTIGALLGVNSEGFRLLERNIKAKLGAKTHPHMMSRAFTLGVLIPRALCLLLSVLCATEHSDDSNRNQTRRNSRTAPASRLARNTISRTASGPGGHHESLQLAQCFQLASASGLAS